MEEVTQDVAESSIYTIPTPGVLPDSDVAEDIKPERENDGSSIFCSVSKPEKVGEGMNAYVTYVVFTKNTDNTNASIARRYSDFSWLHEMLKNDFRNTLIPPLPEKAIFDRFSPEFVEYRRKELERFLKRVLSHPHLSKSPHVTKFLTASDAAMELERSKPKIVVTQQQQQQPKKEEKGFFASLSASLSSVTSVVTGPTVELKEIDPYFEIQRAYISNLDQHLQVLVARSNTNTRKKQEMISSLSDFAHAASLACGCEIGQDDALSDFWGKLSEILNQVASLTDELVHGETEMFEDQVKDYVRLVGACKDLMENRSAVLLELQTCQADATLKSERLQKAQGTPRAPTLDTFLQNANDATNRSEQKYNSITNDIRTELDVFKRKKGQDLRRALRELVRLNINHQLRVVNLWKELLSDLEETKF